MDRQDLKKRVSFSIIKILANLIENMILIRLLIWQKQLNHLRSNKLQQQSPLILPMKKNTLTKLSKIFSTQEPLKILRLTPAYIPAIQVQIKFSVLSMVECTPVVPLYTQKK